MADVLTVAGGVIVAVVVLGSMFLACAIATRFARRWSSR